MPDELSDEAASRLLREMQAIPFCVGLVANGWAKVEQLLGALFQELLGTTLDKARAINFAINPVMRHDLICALNSLTSWNDETISADIDELAREYDRLRVLRNNFVHGTWSGMAPSGNSILWQVKSRREYTEAMTETESSAVMQCAVDMDALLNKISTTIDKIRANALGS